MQLVTDSASAVPVPQSPAIPTFTSCALPFSSSRSYTACFGEAVGEENRASCGEHTPDNSESMPRGLPEKTWILADNSVEMQLPAICANENDWIPTSRLQRLNVVS